MRDRDRCPRGHDNSRGYPEQRYADGTCRECRRVYRADHREEIQARRAAYFAVYRMTHREERQAYFAAYRMAHREKIQAYKATYYATHREQIQAHAADHWLRPEVQERQWVLRYRRAAEQARARMKRGEHRYGD